MKFKLFFPISFTLVQAFTIVNCVYKIKNSDSSNQAKSLGYFKPRLGFPLLSLSDPVGTPNVQNITTTPTGSGAGAASSTNTNTEGFNNVIQALPALKLGLLTTIVKFIEPLLKSFFIVSLIILALSGTAAVLCTIIDCQANFGRHTAWLHSPTSYTSPGSTSTFYDPLILPPTVGSAYNYHQPHSGTLFNNTDTSVIRRRHDFPSNGNGTPARRNSIAAAAQRPKIDFAQHPLERESFQQ